MPVQSKPARVALALGIGALGALVAVLMNVPLALLLGPLLATMVAGLAGVPVMVPNALRMPILAVLGTFLATEFTPDVAARMAQWPLSIASVPVFIVVGTAVAGLYYRRVAGLDPVSAVFAAVPGGLLAMVIIGTQFGGDERRIAIAQVLRVVIAVFAVTYTLWGLFDIQRVQADTLVQGLDADLGQLALVGLVAAAGTLAAHFLRLPAPQFLGPLICVAPLYLTATVSVAIPGPLLAVALWVMGSSVGSRFAGFDTRILARMAGHTFVSVGLLLMVAMGVAGFLWAVAGIPFVAGMLAFSPGGIAEMSLIALALDVDPAYVALHHLVRITVCILLAPMVGRRLGGRDAE